MSNIAISELFCDLEEMSQKTCIGGEVKQGFTQDWRNYKLPTGPKPKIHYPKVRKLPNPYSYYRDNYQMTIGDYYGF